MAQTHKHCFHLDLPKRRPFGCKQSTFCQTHIQTMLSLLDAAGNPSFQKIIN